MNEPYVSPSDIALDVMRVHTPHQTSSKPPTNRMATITKLSSLRVLGFSKVSCFKITCHIMSKAGQSWSNLTGLRTMG